MTSRTSSVTFDRGNAVALAEFWGQVVGRAVSDPGGPGPRIFFQRVA